MTEDEKEDLKEHWLDHVSSEARMTEDDDMLNRKIALRSNSNYAPYVDLESLQWNYCDRINPSEERLYLVSIHFETIGDRVDTDYWDGEEWRDFGSMVYSWRELPKPAKRYNAQES